MTKWNFEGNFADPTYFVKFFQPFPQLRGVVPWSETHLCRRTGGQSGDSEVDLSEEEALIKTSKTSLAKKGMNKMIIKCYQGQIFIIY